MAFIGTFPPLGFGCYCLLIGSSSSSSSSLWSPEGISSMRGDDEQAIIDKEKMR